MGAWILLLIKFRKCIRAGIDIGLNTVIQTTSNKTDVEDMIDFALQHELPLKLLPQIGGEDRCTYKEFVFPLLEKYCIEKKTKGLVLSDGASRMVTRKPLYCILIPLAFTRILILAKTLVR